MPQAWPLTDTTVHRLFGETARREFCWLQPLDVFLALLASFSRHSLRHLAAMNRKHQDFAWLSLCSAGFADLYVRLYSMGIWTDYRIL